MRLNHVSFAGKVQSVSDIRQAGNSKVCTVSLYQSYPKKKNSDGEVAEWHSDWVDVQCWGQTAEVAQNLEKKQEVIVEGRLAYNKWTDKEGNNRKDLKINASFLHKPVAGSTTAEGQTDSDPFPF